MDTFREFLLKTNILENDDMFGRYQNEVFSIMKRMGINDEEYGIALQNIIRDAYEEGASPKEVVSSLIASETGSDYDNVSLR